MLAIAVVASLFCIPAKSRERATAASRVTAASLCPDRDVSLNRYSP
jgi:hypothetical protein